MHDHSRIQLDIDDVTGVSLSLSLSIYLSFSTTYEKSLTHNIPGAFAPGIIKLKLIIIRAHSFFFQSAGMGF